MAWHYHSKAIFCLPDLLKRQPLIPAQGAYIHKLWYGIIIAKESGTGENEFSFTIKQNLKSHTRVRHFNTVWLIKLCWLGLGGRWTLASQLITWNCSLEAIWVLYRPHEALKLVFILDITVNHDAYWKERIF